MPQLNPIKVIGHGAFGFVFEADDAKTSKKVAVELTQKAGNVISREFEILDMLRGVDNCIQLVDFFYSIDENQRVI